MPLTARTKVFVIDKKTGECSKSTLEGWFNSIKGGSRWDDYEITTSEVEATTLGRKYGDVHRVVELMGNMTPEQTSQVVDLVQNREDLMTLAEEYA